MISRTPWGKAVEKEHQISQASRGQQQTIDLVKSPLDERLISAVKFSGFLAKTDTAVFHRWACHSELC